MSHCRGPFGERLPPWGNILKSLISFQQDPRQKLESMNASVSIDYDIFSLTSKVLQNIILPPPEVLSESKLVYFQNQIETNCFSYKRKIRVQSALLELKERIVIYSTARFALEGSISGLSTKVLCTIFYTLLMTSQISDDHDVSELLGLILFTLEESEKIFIMELG